MLDSGHVLILIPLPIPAFSKFLIPIANSDSKKCPFLIPGLKCMIPIPTQVEPLGSDFNSRKNRVVLESILILESESSTTVRQ